MNKTSIYTLNQVYESISSPDDDKIRELQVELEKDPEISLAILFGSYAGGTIRPESDRDREQ
ncbi:MAG: hypothetical protein V3V31_08245 [Methylococcales bacterium]